MTPQQQAHVRDSWALVAPIADDAARMFYDRLFEIDPSLRPMFAHVDMAGQRKVLVQTLAVVVRGIDRLDTLIPALEALGRRHVGYGVRPDHYATVGRALLDTLAAGLGGAFTDEVRAAWSDAYGLLAGVMVSAAEGAEAETVAAAA